MVETSIVLPVTVLITLTVILIIVFFCEISTEQYRMHMALTSKSGEASGHTEVTCKTPEFSGSVSDDGKIVSAFSDVAVMNLFSVLHNDSFRTEGKRYITDGVKNVRRKTWIDKITESD